MTEFIFYYDKLRELMKKTPAGLWSFECETKHIIFSIKSGFCDENCHKRYAMYECKNKIFPSDW